MVKIMKIKGRAHVFGDDVDTDAIIPGPYLRTTDVYELASHCMAGVDEDFPKKVKEGDVIVAGENFGCGSSREQAGYAIKYNNVKVKQVAKKIGGYKLTFNTIDQTFTTLVQEKVDVEVTDSKY